MKRKKRKQLLIIILILLISIGFSFLSSNIGISGLGIFKENSWNLYFDNVIVDKKNTSELSEAIISEDKKTINFSINLEKPGSMYLLYADIVNDGTIDAMLDSLKVNGVPNELDNVILIQLTYSDFGEIKKNDLLKQKSSEKIRLLITFLDPDNSELPSLDGSLNLSLSFNYVQADEDAVVRLKKDSAADKIIDLSKNSTEIVEDNTIDKNLRYVGANPNNYVYFNNELWRIIGVFNNTEDKYEIKTSRVKLVRNDTIGSFSMDITDSSINGGYGVNNWSTTNLAYNLNNSYLYSKIGDGYTGFNKPQKLDFTSNGIKKEFRDYIENMIWDTSIVNWTDSTTNNAIYFYNSERSGNTTVGCTSGSSSNCTDTFERFAKWTGKVAIIYASDFAFATDGSAENSREYCWGLPLADRNYTTITSYDYSCHAKNWIAQTFWGNNYNTKDNSIWTLDPINGNDSYSRRTFFHVGSTTNDMHSSNLSYTKNQFPSIYLDENVVIIGGSGSSVDPFILSM